MTEKEKAKELVFKFDDTMEFSTPQRFAKRCALIAVNELIKETGSKYWYNVKQELEKL